ncbi:MAG TPA: hypothetical protein PK668_22730 [Myxococcota bacterium]|nr:hypothetical protein [Myxococcota bacterium]HRY95510.1 hypothetical protein [Myxococcota bacterium]HSA22725.1 hypothetical protein [Myxococcota bacterium]
MASTRAGRIAWAALALLGTSWLTGCAATFAPPMQSTHYGAPGRLRLGEMEVRGAATLFGSGTGAAGIHLTDSLKLELAGDAKLVDSEKWAVGTAGVRYTFGGKAHGDWWAFDLEAGLGAGAGGVLDGDETGDGGEVDEDAWRERLAVGAYVGAGFGFHPWDFFALFLRARVQESFATCLPPTFWWSALAGIELTVFPVSLYVAAGVAGYENSVESEIGVLPELGLSAHF